MVRAVTLFARRNHGIVRNDVRDQFGLLHFVEHGKGFLQLVAPATHLVVVEVVVVVVVVAVVMVLAASMAVAVVMTVMWRW